jgi:acyl carrier protein
MPPPIRPPSGPAVNSAAVLLRHFSQDVRDAFTRFRESGDAADADFVVLAAVRDHIPNKAAVRPAALDDGKILIDDLGFDSMAITELVFFLEDLFQVAITNDEIVRVRTVGDLRAFVRQKISGAPGSTG